ncbi:hypothetical protein VTK73DRAFT_1073 [Phialemonium thermophilum]|uniref:Uncharacterized protein n=1 Tax=Phialemonium thermophilum TaxID=223376 RepID=A0ABR3VTW6_9PEZI
MGSRLLQQVVRYDTTSMMEALIQSYQGRGMMADGWTRRCSAFSRNLSAQASRPPSLIYGRWVRLSIGFDLVSPSSLS